MSGVYLPGENAPGQEAGIPPCPVCGAKAFLRGDTVDGFFMGYSVGCPRYCLYDGIHGHDNDTPKSERLTAHGFYTKEGAANWWRRRANR